MIELPPKIDKKLLVNVLLKGSDAEIIPIIDKVNADYEYWDKVKYKPLPEGYTTQMLWTHVKASRLRGKMVVWNKYGINLCITSQMQRMCHDFDMKFGSFWEDDKEAKSPEKSYYLSSSLMEEAIYSSKMEGASTTRVVAKEMLRKKKSPQNKAQQMIVNNYNTIQYIVDHKDDSLTEALAQNIVDNYSTTEETYGEIQGAIEEIQTYTFYKYASDGTGTGFSDNTSLQYRGVYTSIENEASTNPRDYKWEINPVWAAQVAENYIEDEVSENGFRIISPDPSTYARFTALFMAFFMNDILQMRMGYDSVNEVYGVMAHDIFALGSGAGVKFDGGSDSTVRGRFVQEIRDNGHWSLKRY